MNKQFLITGIGSGLGKYLYSSCEYSKEGLNRLNFEEIKNNKYDTIIHCAFNKTNNIENHYQYLNDNIFLTQKLLELDYSYFVYISSVDVYSQNETLYALFKKFAESIVMKKDNFLILRCPAMFGTYMKENHLTKIVSGQYYKIGLSGESIFNYISFEQLANFFWQYGHNNFVGVYDFVSNENVKLNQLKEEFFSKIEFGDFVYSNPDKFPNPIYTGKTSLQNVKEYFK